ncbi:MAG: NAD(P)H-hydrate dehydratase [Hyphomonadaceae bacterium]
MSAAGHEIISVAEMRAIDARSVALGVPILTLMEHAGEAVAEAVLARYTPCKTAVLCGPGDNGGDGYVVARRLKEAGWPVWVARLGAPQSDAAQEMARRWTGETHELAANNPEAALYIDALFGAGLARPLEGEAARLAALLPAERVVAVDVPSGLHGDLARPLGDVSFRAALTVTFIRKKAAHVLQPGRALCGAVIVNGIGAPAQAIAEQNLRLWENGTASWALPWPQAAAHKHVRGHALIVSGPSTRTGAARLAARGALRAGAGLVTVLSPPDALAEHAARLDAIMLRRVERAEDVADAAADAQSLVIGPAHGVNALLTARLHALRPNGGAKRPTLVLDADVFSAFADDPETLFSMLGDQDVLTPHLGEFRRVFPDLDVGAGRISAARTAAARAGANVLLKGPDTIIASPDGRAIVNTSGTPFLATAGSGDVLAGIIAGLLAQGMAGFEAAAAGAWLHGRAGEARGAGLIAEDLPEALPSILDPLWRSSSLG